MLTESVLGADWRVGKVDSVRESRDGVVREVFIAFKREIGEECSVVERPARKVIKLFHLEDTTFMDQLRDIEKFSRELLTPQVSLFRAPDTTKDPVLEPETRDPSIITISSFNPVSSQADRDSETDHPECRDIFKIPKDESMLDDNSTVLIV